MAKKYKTKEIGKITDNIAKKHNIEQYINYPIVQSLGLPYHTSKHANDFHTVDSYNQTLLNVEKVIKKPYHVEYDKKRNSLKYYGKVEQYTCIVVNILENNAYVSTIYPISKVKIDKIKEKSK